MSERSELIALPSIKELGLDLLELNFTQKLWTIIKPFLVCISCFYFLIKANFIMAIVSIIVLLFVTFVSTSHDLVHNALRINKKLSSFLLSITEMLVLRSGHAFKICHLQHHRFFPEHEDIEGSTAHTSFFRALLEGPIYFFRLYIWAWKNSKKTDKIWLLIEAIWFIVYLTSALFLYNIFPELLYYFILIQIGSWVYPLFTVYIPHNAKAKDPIYQTRAFRGFFISLLFAHHNYHLEHHLYPMVPHQNWKKLADRLNPYFISANVIPIKF